MIGLRVLHLLSPFDGPLGAGGVANLMRWLRDHGHHAALLTSGGDHEGDLVADDFPVIRYRPGKAAWWFGGRSELLRRLADWAPDLIHVHDLANLRLGLSVAKPLGVRVLAGATTLATADQARPLRDQRVAWLAVPSEVHRAHYVGRLGVQRDRVTVLPQGLDLQKSTGSIQRPAGGPPVIGAIAPLVAGSGLNELIEAFAALHQQGVPFRGIIAGQGAEERELRHRLDYHRLHEVVQITTAVVPMGRLIGQFDIVVHPAREDRFSPVVPAALAAARPVVAAAVGGITDLVRDGHNGLLVAPGEVPALAAALRALVVDPAKARAFGEAGRAIVAERFDIELVGQAAEELYRKVVADARTATAKAEGCTVYRRITKMRVKA